MAGTEEKQVLCTVCPRGCRITVSLADGAVRDLTGYSCARGKKYATDEVTVPRRVLTTTVRCGEGMLSVKSSSALRRERIGQYLAQINCVSVTPPVSVGDVILPDIDGEGTDIVATKNIQ